MKPGFPCSFFLPEDHSLVGRDLHWTGKKDETRTEVAGESLHASASGGGE